jgi:flagellar hook-length control protein FliK
VIVLNSAGDAVPAAANASLQSVAIGVQSKARLQVALSGLPGQDAQSANGAAATKPSVSDAAAPLASPDVNATAAPTVQAQISPDNQTLIAAQPDAGTQAGDQATFQATINLGAGHANAAATGDGVSGGQPATGAAKTVSSDLPSLGVVATGTAVSQTAPATPGAAAVVPISALPVAIAARAKAGSNQFDIRLDPPELGRIDVRLDVDASGQVTSHVTADRPETLALLQSQQPQLEHALEQAGLKPADNGLQFSLRDQSFTGQNNNNGGAQPGTPQLAIHDPELAPIETRQIYARVSLGGGIDIRV